MPPYWFILYQKRFSILVAPDDLHSLKHYSVQITIKQTEKLNINYFNGYSDFIDFLLPHLMAISDRHACCSYIFFQGRLFVGQDLHWLLFSFIRGLICPFHHYIPRFVRFHKRKHNWTICMLDYIQCMYRTVLYIIETTDISIW